MLSSYVSLTLHSGLSGTTLAAFWLRFLSPFPPCTYKLQIHNPFVLIFIRNARGVLPSAALIMISLLPMFSNSIRHRRLHPVEKEESAENNEGDGESRNHQQQPRRLAPPGDGPPESVNDARHGLESVQPPPPLRHYRPRIRHRRPHHPDLD